MSRPGSRALLGVLAWLAACGGGSTEDPCRLPRGGAGFLFYAAVTGADYDIRAVMLDGRCDQLVAAGPGDDLYPAVSATSGALAWSGIRGGTNRIIVRSDLAAADRVLETGAALSTSPALSPDGLTVLFEHRPPLDTSDLGTVPVAGGAVTLLVSGSGNDAGPAYSPDGQTVYFVSNRSGADEIWRASAPAWTPEQVTTGAAVVGRPAVSGDGLLLAYGRASQATGGTVVLRVLATGAERVLSDEGDSEPAFPASGGLIAVRTTRWGGTDIALLEVSDGTVSRRLTNGATLVGTPAFPR